MRLALIAAIAQNRGIGIYGRLPWHLPEDLRRFKQLTIGHTVLMGRRTFDSLGRPLPKRRNIVVTSRPVEGVECYSSAEAALLALENETKVFVIGGSRLFHELLPRADDLYLTLVHSDVDADTFFPPFEEILAASFREVHRETRDGFSFVDYIRTGS